MCFIHAPGHHAKQRRSIRLKHYDYSQNRVYFVTICTHKYKRQLGDIVDGKMILNEAEEMAEKWWQKLNKKFQSFVADSHVVMLNHFHGIVIIDNKPNDNEMPGVGAGVCVSALIIFPRANTPTNPASLNDPVV